MQTFTGRQYLKIDIANSFGLDKLDWNDRLAWFEQNEPRLNNLLSEAKEPAMFYAGVLAWKAVSANQPIGYMISLDATSSGLQILAALTGDRSAAELCNVVNANGKRMDAYKAIYELMLQELNETGKISRDDVKDAIMTSLYGSKALPKQVFGEGALLTLFYDTMQRAAPAAWELNETMLALWNPEALSHDWVMPDNFHVRTKVMDTVTDTVHFLNQPFQVHYKVNRPMEEGRSLGANMVHSIDGMIVREMSRRCDYNRQKVSQICDWIESGAVKDTSGQGRNTTMVQQLWAHYESTGYLSARILNYLQEDNFGFVSPAAISELIQSLPSKPFKVIAVHDCFRCLPHYGNDLRRQYNLQLHLIAKSDLLSSLLSQITGQQIHINKLDPTLAYDILETDYALS